MRSLPPTGIGVVLERDDAGWLDAEVLRYDEGDVVVRLDTDSDGVGAVPLPVTLVWHTDRGVFRAAATIVADGTGRTHRVRIDDTERLQRREYHRLAMGTGMTVSHAGGLSPATLVDVSEVALRARLSDLPAPGLRAGDEVTSAFSLAGTGFMLRGTVLREVPVVGGMPGDVEVVIILDASATAAHDLRRSVVFERLARERVDR